MKYIRMMVMVLSVTVLNAWLPASAFAEEAISAHQTVEVVTKRVLSLINEANSYIDKEPERFYRELEVVLDEVVDFDSFSRGVMGPYASKKYYMQLSAEQKKAFRGQVKRFSDTFKKGLVETYAKGLLAFGSTRFEVVGEDQADQDDSVTVLQKIYGEADKPYEVLYKMRLNAKGEWKLRNVTIEAVNLGKVYQGQFLSAVKQYEGDIDKVIDNWSIKPGDSVKAG